MQISVTALAPFNNPEFHAEIASQKKKLAGDIKALASADKAVDTRAGKVERNQEKHSTRARADVLGKVAQALGGVDAKKLSSLPSLKALRDEVRAELQKSRTELGDVARLDAFIGCGATAIGTNIESLQALTQLVRFVKATDNQILGYAGVREAISDIANELLHAFQGLYRFGGTAQSTCHNSDVATAAFDLAEQVGPWAMERAADDYLFHIVDNHSAREAIRSDKDVAAVAARAGRASRAPYYRERLKGLGVAL